MPSFFNCSCNVLPIPFTIDTGSVLRKSFSFTNSYIPEGFAILEDIFARYFALAIPMLSGKFNFLNTVSFMVFAIFMGATHKSAECEKSIYASSMDAI